MLAISRLPRSADPPPRRHSVIAAFGYAFEGLAAAWRTQRNVRIQAVLALIVAALGLALRFSALSWSLVVLSIALVVAVEVVNTAIEAVVDLVSPHEHPLAKRAKDLAAAAVLLASSAALAVGILVVVQTLRGR